MSEAQQGNTVKVAYTGKLENGAVFASCDKEDPLEFSLGDSQLIPAFQEAVMGMQPGETKSVTVPFEEAFGPHRDDLVMDVSKDKLPEGLEPEVGQGLEVRSDEGQSTPVRITEVGDDTVKLDANHPLAGENLTFDIELLEVAPS